MQASDFATIKALERMSAEDPNGFSSDVLALINRLKSDNIKLEVQHKLAAARAANVTAETAREFVERLNEKVFVFAGRGDEEYCRGCDEVLEWYDAKVQETLKEMTDCAPRNSD